MAKNFFAEKGIVFDEIDVSIDEAAAKEMIDRTGQMGVPVIEIESDVVVGFDRAVLENLIEKNSTK